MKVSSDTYQGCNNRDRNTVRDRSTVRSMDCTTEDVVLQKKKKRPVDMIYMIYDIYTVISTLPGKKV